MDTLANSSAACNISSVSESEKMDAFYPAFLKAQAEMTAAKKDAANEHFRSRYATLAAVNEACRMPLINNGFCLLQPWRTDWQNNILVVTVTTILHHAPSSQRLAIATSAPCARQDAQAIGSAITYLRRYALCALLCLSTDDDDGNSACKPAQKQADYPSGTNRISQQTLREKELTKIWQNVFKQDGRWMYRNISELVGKVVTRIDEVDNATIDRFIYDMKKAGPYIDLDEFTEEENLRTKINDPNNEINYASPQERIIANIYAGNEKMFLDDCFAICGKRLRNARQIGKTDLALICKAFDLLDDKGSLKPDWKTCEIAIPNVNSFANPKVQTMPVTEDAVPF